METLVFNVADLKDPNDDLGRSYREINNNTKHLVKVGSLVEIDTGVRLFVVKHNRDCDGTPLYELCHDKNDTTQHREGFRNPDWVGGYCEESIREI